jgi:hypothetical protein
MLGRPRIAPELEAQNRQIVFQKPALRDGLFLASKYRSRRSTSHSHDASGCRPLVLSLDTISTLAEAELVIRYRMSVIGSADWAWDLPDLLCSDATAIEGTPTAEHVSAFFSIVFATHPARVSARASIFRRPPLGLDCW